MYTLPYQLHYNGACWMIRDNFAVTLNNMIRKDIKINQEENFIKFY